MNEIATYVATVRRRLLLPAAQADRLCEEIETHLLESAAGRGSQSAAVGAFGSAWTVAGRANLTLAAVPGAVASIAAMLTSTALMVTGSVLASSLLAPALAQMTSTNFVYAPGSRFHPSVTACARWEAIHPTATSCEAAYTLENRSDSIALVLLATVIVVLGSGFVAAFLWLTRSRVTCLRLSARASAASRGALFAGASAVLAAGTLVHPDGTGLGWTRAAVAACVAGGYAIRYRTSAPSPSSNLP